MYQPPMIKKINAIRFWLTSSCQVPWYIYFEEMREPTVNAIYTLLMFDVGDALRSLLRPKPNRTKRHGRKKPPPRRRRRKGIPETSDLIIRPLGDALGLPNRQINDGARHLWKIDTIGQKFLYKYLILGLVTDWTYEWLLGIIDNDEVNCDFGRIKGNQHEHHINGGDGWAFLKADGEIEYQHGDCGMNFGSVFVGPGNWQIVGAAKAACAAAFEADTKVGLGLSFSGSPGKIRSQGGVHTVSRPQDGGEADCVVGLSVKGPGTIQLRCKSEPWRAVYWEISLMASQVNAPAI